MRVGRELAKQVIHACQLLHQRSWVANHDGNITARVGSGRFLATPTATAKGAVHNQGLIEVDATGARVAGTARPFGELPMHLAIYRVRDDVHAVVHAHPPYATALACSGVNLLERPFIAEAVVSLGARIPLLPFSPPGARAADVVAEVATSVDAVLLANHGVFAWGADIEQAFLRLELVEHLARIATLAQATGGVVPLPADAIPPLLAARARAGLGKAADAASRAVVACAPAPHAPTTTVSPGRGNPDRDQLADLVRDELRKALKSS